MPDRSPPQSDQPGIIDSDLLDPHRRAANKLPETESEPGSLMVELNVEHRQGIQGTKKRFFWLFEQVVGSGRATDRGLTALSDPYLRCKLSIEEVNTLLKLDRFGSKPFERGVYRIWMDYLVKSLIYRSSLTVKADASRFFFNASGEGIVWAVIDSGIDADHPHFRYHHNLGSEVANLHRDFVGQSSYANACECMGTALTDGAGHGTHVAGIIAGGIPGTLLRSGKIKIRVAEHTSAAAHIASDTDPFDIELIKAHEHELERTQDCEEIKDQQIEPIEIQGIAPLCKVVSLKVLDDHREGRTSDVIMALRYVREEVNNGGEAPADPWGQSLSWVRV